MLVRMARRWLKIEYKTLMVEAGLLRGYYTPLRRTITRILKRAGLTNYRCVTRPKFNAGVAALRLRFGREHCYFNWRRRVVKFTDECLVQRGLGEQAEWCFRFPHEKYYPKMVTPKKTAKQMSQMVWGSIWVTLNG